MIKHILVFKVKEGIEDEAVNRLVMEFNRFPEEIQEIENWCLGPNMTSRERIYSHALVAEFRDWDSFNSYMVNPFHLDAYRQYYRPIIEKSAVIQFEF